ncbi:MAG: iron-containing alcohol dehydrogenase [Actinobacteria bacterium]|nr:iron-containing alcohol dehydrogenase [Actinomycetota bacterium]
MSKEDLKNKAKKILTDFKKGSYIFGPGCIDRAGGLAAKLGRRAVLVISSSGWAEKFKGNLLKSLKGSNIEIAAVIGSSKPNCPLEDLHRMHRDFVRHKPEFIIAAGGGSTIDCAKAASILAGITPGLCDIEPFFGTGAVTEAVKKTGRRPIAVFAVQMSASSAAHLTKYSNITDLKTGQKKLIVDDAIVPPFALFDYSVTQSMNRDLTIDGILDGISHMLEVYYGTSYECEPEKFNKIEEIALTGLKLLVSNLSSAVANGKDLKIRELVGLGTDLGGCAIMLGGTNGAHLTSFSFVDFLSHGRACGLMNPYYTVFFAPAIRRQLINIAPVFIDYMDFGSGLNNLYSGENMGLKLSEFSSRQIAEIVAGAMINFLKSAGIATRLSDVKGFSQKYIDKAIKNAKNPQLEMKLKNMPVALNSGFIDRYMLPVLEAAKTGDFSLIENCS